ncbi:MAG: hypothetical protein JHC33_03690 [Ignisphaera sp.]|nr:hypothetical protein [Ignisphaera sp.]
MNTVEMLIHPTCGPSYRLVKDLGGRGLLDKVRIIVADEPRYALSYGVFSVPWVTLNGVPVDAKEVDALITGSGLGSRDPVEAVKKTILYSNYLSSVVALWGSVDPILTREVVAVATRAYVTGANVDDVLKIVSEKREELYKELEEPLVKALAVGFVRELFWASSAELDEEKLKAVTTPITVRLWLIAKASVGRVGIPSKPWATAREVSQRISDYVQRNASIILARVREEYTKIVSDEEYWSIIEKAKARETRNKG